MRTAFTALVIILGLAIVGIIFVTSKPTPPASQQTPAAAGTTGGVVATGETVAPPATAPATAPSPAPDNAPHVAPTTASAPAIAPTGFYVARPTVPASDKPVVLGHAASGSPYKIEVALNRFGAAISRIDLSDYRDHALSPSPYNILHPVEAPISPGAVDKYKMFPFAARAVHINGTRVDLQAAEWTVNESDETRAVYALTINDGADAPAIRITRTYRIERDSYHLACDQRITNLSGASLKIAWEQNALGDMPAEDASLLGDQRYFVGGYFDPDYNPGRTILYTDKAYLPRITVIDALAKDNTPFWPSAGVPKNAELAWLGFTNRYFTTAVHRPVPQGATDTSQIAPLVKLFPTVGTVVIGHAGKGEAETRAALFTLTSAAADVAPGATRDFDLAVFAGPRDPVLFKSPTLAALHLDRLVVYNLGGLCSFCTFQWLAHLLIAVLRFIHSITHDWSLAIIMLVIFVRLLLHPITRRAQINMARTGKRMAALKPEIEKIKKKYPDDLNRQRSETLKLQTEAGINPLNFLGCLPMFLQMPIWIALYAMLFFAIELRQQPAFYGLFQSLSGGKWTFFADLSTADHFFLVFAQPVTIPLLFIDMKLQWLNVLPFVMALVSFYQQKLTVPPATDEQTAQQQKIMKWMVLLFPLMLYSTPSGLTLYIVVSTLIGIGESLLVKRHIKHEEEAGTLFKTQPPKPGSIGDRLSRVMQMMQEAQKERERQQNKRR